MPALAAGCAAQLDLGRVHGGVWYWYNACDCYSGFKVPEDCSIVDT